MKESFSAVLEEAIRRSVAVFTEFITLLPKEYHNDVFGYSWSTICKTAFVGFIMFWIFFWSYFTSRRRRYVKELHNLSEHRFNVGLKMEKLLCQAENKTSTKTQELQVLQKELEDQKQQLGETLQKYEELQQNVIHAREENQEKSNQIRDFIQKIENFQRENENLTAKFKEVNKRLEDKSTATIALDSAVKAITEDFEQSKKQCSELQQKLKEIQNRSNAKDKAINKQEKAIKQAEDQTKSLIEKVEALEQKLSLKEDEATHARKECDVLRDCVLQIKAVQESVAENADEELESDELEEKQNEKVKELLDLIKLREEFNKMKMEKEKALSNLQVEIDLRNKAEICQDHVRLEAKSYKEMQIQAERNLEIERSKIVSMEEYFAKRDMDFQQELIKTNSEKKLYSSTAEESEKKIAYLQEELQTYMKMAADSKREYDDNDRRLKSDIKIYEKKAHSNWLSCKETERKLDEMSRDFNQLKRDFSDLEDRAHEAEMREALLHRPRPRFGFSRPPFPHPPHSPSFRSGMIRTPNESMHSDRGTPDRPPSQTERQRPPSRNPPNDVLEIGEGRSFRDNDSNHIPAALENPPPADGQPLYNNEHFREGPIPVGRFPGPIGPRMGGVRPPLPIRPPSRDGPPMDRFGNNGYPPRDRSHGSPSFRDVGPMIRDGPPPTMPRHGPPMGERPHYGPPPQMYEAPSAGYHRPSPRPIRPGSRQDGNSPYNDHSMLPSRDSSSSLPMIPLHGNLPRNNVESEYDLHPVKGSAD